MSTLYLRSDTWTVNGVSGAYKLIPDSNSSSDQYLEADIPIYAEAPSGQFTVSLYKVPSAGWSSKTLIGSGVVFTSAGWPVTPTFTSGAQSLGSTDALAIQITAYVNDGADATKSAIWITAVNPGSLTSTTWTFNAYTYIDYDEDNDTEFAGLQFGAADAPSAFTNVTLGGSGTYATVSQVHGTVTATGGSNYVNQTLAKQVGNDVLIQWVPYSGADSYKIYGSNTYNFTPGSGNLLASGVTGTSYTHSAPANGRIWFYKIVPVISGTDQTAFTTDYLGQPLYCSLGTQTVTPSAWRSAEVDSTPKWGVLSLQKTSTGLYWGTNDQGHATATNGQIFTSTTGNDSAWNLINLTASPFSGLPSGWRIYGRGCTGTKHHLIIWAASSPTNVYIATTTDGSLATGWSISTLWTQATYGIPQINAGFIDMGSGQFGFVTCFDDLSAHAVNWLVTTSDEMATWQYLPLYTTTQTATDPDVGTITLYNGRFNEAGYAINDTKDKIVFHFRTDSGNNVWNSTIDGATYNQPGVTQFVGTKSGGVWSFAYNGRPRDPGGNLMPMFFATGGAMVHQNGRFWTFFSDRRWSYDGSGTPTSDTRQGRSAVWLYSCPDSDTTNWRLEMEVVRPLATSTSYLAGMVSVITKDTYNYIMGVVEEPSTNADTYVADLSFGDVSATVTQAAATVTAYGGTQTATTTRLASVTQVSATVTATGGTQVMTAVLSANATQTAAVVTVTGGTQSASTTRLASVTQSGATVTVTGGNEVVANVNDVSITQVGATVTVSGGTQTASGVVAGTVNVSQLAATVTASGGTQNSSAVVALSSSVSQVGANVTASGGTNSLTSIQNTSVTQASASITAAGGTQTLSALIMAQINQIGASVTAQGGTQVVSTASAVSLWLNPENSFIYDEDFAMRLGPSRMSTWKTSGRPTAPLEGTYGYNIDTSKIEVYVGGNWY